MRTFIPTLTCTLLLLLYSCSSVKVVNGKVFVTNIPSEVKTVMLTLQSGDNVLTVKRNVNNGTIEPVALGELFAGKTYPPGTIQLDTFDGSGGEKNYSNNTSVEVPGKGESKEIPMSNFSEN